MASQIENFGDLLTVTLANFNEPDFVNLTTDLTDFPAAKQFLQPNMRRYRSGKTCDWRIKVTNGNSAKNVAITDQDQSNIVDGFISASVNWRKSMASYSFYEEEQTINMTPKRLVDLVKSRENGASEEFVSLLESNFWNNPAASDIRTPLGVPYWVYKNATQGFNGGIPTGYTSVGGVSPTTYPRWASYTDQYTAISMDDFVRKARLMRVQTRFKPRVAAVPELTTGEQRKNFGGLTLTQRLADLVDLRNENFGSDLAKNDLNETMIGGTGIVYIPQLNADTTNPMYQIDFGYFKIIVLGPWWMKRKVISPVPGQRNVVSVYIDCVYQIVCFNRRAQGVIATGTSYPS